MTDLARIIAECKAVLAHGHISSHRISRPYLEALLSAAKRCERMEMALNERDLFINPDALDEAADEIDCCPGCERYWHEPDTNASGCKAHERGEYCPNDVAETLRAVAKVARQAL